MWSTGVYVGYRTISGEYMVVTEDGAYKSRTLRRLPEEERWRRVLVETMKYLPWKTKVPVEGKGSDPDQEDASNQHEPSIAIPIDRREMAEPEPAPAADPVP